MPRTDFTISTPDGDAAATLHTPDGDGPWPGVLLYPDAGGVRPAIHDMRPRGIGLRQEYAPGAARA